MSPIKYVIKNKNKSISLIKDLSIDFKASISPFPGGGWEEYGVRGREKSFFFFLNFNYLFGARLHFFSKNLELQL